MEPRTAHITTGKSWFPAGISRGLSPRWGVCPQKAKNGAGVWGFTLLEILIVVLLIGILAGMGSGYYSRMTEDMKTETLADSLTAFFAACRSRAVSRGMDVKPVLTGKRLGIEGSNLLTCSLPAPSSASAQLLANLLFTASQTLLHGKPVNALPLTFLMTTGRETKLTVKLGLP